MGSLCSKKHTFLFLCLFAIPRLNAQIETASLTGTVQDSQGLPVPNAEVTATRIETGASATTRTNGVGVYFFSGLVPGRYRMTVEKQGFKEIVTKDFSLEVQQKLEQDFSLEVGSTAEKVTVDATALVIDTQDATVSTVVDRQFAENLPLNGRSFQSLIELAPGVVVTANNGSETGQFSVNGQRADANYWTVDGVSANIGMSAAGYVGEGLAGALGATNVFGGTNSLVSVDALQEFRIQTSTYAPEFGRTPGGQISIVTRSGTNQFHGSAFDYFRNDALDANDWFANSAGLPKAKERQNDFGGTFGGPILKNNTFFFFSYEGLRLQLPQTALALVPDTNPQDPYSRQFAMPALQPYLNAYALPNGPEVLDANGNHQGVAQFNTTFSNPGTLNAYSLRVDHRFSDTINFFARYNYSPSSLTERGFYSSLATVSPTHSNTQTATAGLTWIASPTVVNDFRFNFSKTDNFSTFVSDNFGGAQPLTILPFPNPFTARNALVRFSVFSLGNYSDIVDGAGGANLQRQYNIVDSVSTQTGNHALKFGVDYRRLSPSVFPSPGVNSQAYSVLAAFPDVPSAETGSALYIVDSLTLPVTFLFRNLGLYAQDTWRVRPRLTITYGLRWDVDFVPSTLAGPGFGAVTGFDLGNLNNLAQAPAGTKPYATTWGNFAPRAGVAYQLSPSNQWQTVVRGGLGIFYDLASSESGNLYSNYNYPFGSIGFVSGNFPIAPPPQPVEPANATNGGTLYSVDPHLQLPYTLEWNVAIEQGLGSQQTFTASYVGAAGRRLLMEASITNPNPNLAGAVLVTNEGSSNYNALQLQFQRRLASGLQALASYSWAHSIDTASGGSSENPSNALAGINANVNRGPSAFDIRHSLSAAMTYDIPAPKVPAFARWLLEGWSLNNIVQVRSAPPLDVFYTYVTSLSNGFYTDVRPDLVPGQPVFFYGSQSPGGKAINPGAFQSPPVTPSGCVPGGDSPCNPIRQGDLGRNALRGFGSAQWDFAVHRDFVLLESLKLQLRAEMFNVLNHPNFGPPAGNLGNPSAINPQFGESFQMLGQSLAGGNVGAGAFDPLYQLGGPRSVQLALKLIF